MTWQHCMNPQTFQLWNLILPQRKYKLVSVVTDSSNTLNPNIETGSSGEEETITNLSLRSLEESPPIVGVSARENSTLRVGSNVEYYDPDVIDIVVERISTPSTVFNGNSKVGYYEPDSMVNDIEHVQGVKSAAIRSLSLENILSYAFIFAIFF